MNLSAKYASLKKRVGGNREQKRFEDTFGQPLEEQLGITPYSKCNKRILSQVEFAIRLSKELDGKYDAVINEALDYLTRMIDADGVLTNSVCMKAEEMLLPLSASAKEYKLILAGHAHLDMNWMWSWHETVAATLATFRTMLRIMDEYPDFCFSQSQAAVYKIVEDFEPEMMERIKARIAEGRWEVTASAWVETDKNMPSTESLIKHIKYTKNYMRDNWGIDPDSLEVDFSPDTFGHSANLPELNMNGGVKYYYHCRALEGNQALYRWVGPSGKELLCYREQYWYNSGITPKIALGIFDISKRCAGFKTGLIIYGVGDHGGGPTRRDVERAMEMMEWPIFPTIKFGTLTEFFHEAESVRDQLPVVDRELNIIFPGCYTTQSRIKMGNRKCENAFADAEALSAFAQMDTHRPARMSALERSYRNVLFTHFHDILTGSCVQDSREHAMGLYSESLALANNEYLGAMSAISEATDTSFIVTALDTDSQAEGAGPGYGMPNFGGKPASESGNGITRIFTVFNPTAVDKKENVEITVWDWTGDLRLAHLTSANGDPVEFQMLTQRPETYWDHKYIKLLAHLSLKAMSYTTLVFTEKELTEYPLFIRSHSSAAHPNENAVLDNGIVRAEFDYTDGSLVSFKDIESGQELIKEGKKASFVLIDTEKDSSNAWNIGKYQRITPVDQLIRFRSGSGALRSSVHFEAKVMSSIITADVRLDKGARHLTLSTTVDWKEIGGESIPVLAFALPLSYTATNYLYDIPGGTVTRGAMDLDVPGLSFALAANEEGKLSAGFINDCKYGYRARPDGTLISTLINSSTSPDSYPERGIHRFELSIGAFDGSAKAMCDYASSVCRAMTYISTTSHKGDLPVSASLMDICSNGCVISSVSVADDRESLTVRAYAADEGGDITLTFTKDIADACSVDYLDRPDGKEVTVKDRSVSVIIGKGEIVTLKIKFLNKRSFK